ncbi:hypothetical protein AAMO2058_000844700 [Amorphochlora amoebiformis]
MDLKTVSELCECGLWEKSRVCKAKLSKCKFVLRRRQIEHIYRQKTRTVAFGPQQNIQIQQDTSKFFYGDRDDSTGNVVWGCGLLMADVLYWVSCCMNLLLNKSVLELGSGTGLGGICAALGGAKHVILTDRMSLDLAKANATALLSKTSPKLNHIPTESTEVKKSSEPKKSSKSKKSSEAKEISGIGDEKAFGSKQGGEDGRVGLKGDTRMDFTQYRWGTPLPTNIQQLEPDIIIQSDGLYFSASHNKLLKTLLTLLNTQNKAVIVIMIYKQRNPGHERAFFRSLLSHDCQKATEPKATEAKATDPKATDQKATGAKASESERQGPSLTDQAEETQAESIPQKDQFDHKSRQKKVNKLGKQHSPNLLSPERLIALHLPLEQISHNRNIHLDATDPAIKGLIIGRARYVESLPLPDCRIADVKTDFGKLRKGKK